MKSDLEAVSIYMLDISAVMMGAVSTIHPTVIVDSSHTILVDTGYPGQYPLLQDAMKACGLSTEKITHIIVTHQDLDHIGSLPVIREHAPIPVELMASAIERPYIQGEKRLIKVTPEAIEQAKAMLPADLPESWRTAFISTLENPPKSNVDTVIQAGQELPLCGGIIVIGTPGHTPGHISLYHKPSKTLIAGDALRIVDGRLSKPDPEQSVDMPLAVQSIAKLAGYDINTVICYHGGRYEGNVNQIIGELALQGPEPD